MPSMDRIMADARNASQRRFAEQERARQDALREQQAAGLATRWQVIMVSGSPIDPDGAPGFALSVPWHGLPDPVRRLLEPIAWAEPESCACWRCGTPIGLVRVGADPADGARWEPFGVVRRLDQRGEIVDEAPSAQCSSCCPDQVATPWPGTPLGAWWGDLSECVMRPDGARVIHVTDPGAASCRCGGSQPRMAPQVAGTARLESDRQK